MVLRILNQTIDTLYMLSQINYIGDVDRSQQLDWQLSEGVLMWTGSSANFLKPRLEGV